MIFALLMMASESVAVSLLQDFPGMSEIEHIVDMNDLVSTCAVCVLILRLILFGVGVIGYCGACCEIRILLYLVSYLFIVLIHRVSKKLSRFVFVRTASNFHRF